METDWKKKYEEALNLAKSYYGKSQNEFLDTLFPELCESEDERTKKWILEYLYDGLHKSDEQFKQQFKSAIAWLEKQKEQKPEWSEEDGICLQDALWCVKQASKIARDESDMGACWSAERWLNSLNNRGNSPKSNTNSPSWKPSEEQMRQLGYVAEQNKHNMLGKELMTLYDDLKKLM